MLLSLWQNDDSAVMFIWLHALTNTGTSWSYSAPQREREAQAAPGALVGTGPSAARWRLHYLWDEEACETCVSWNKVKLNG